MKKNKLRKCTLSNNQTNFLNYGSLIINEKLVNLMLKNDTNYQIITFEGTMDFNTRQPNLAFDGIGVHTIKKFKNKNQLLNSYRTLLKEAITKSMAHHIDLIKLKYPDLTPINYDKMIPTFKITILIIATLKNKNVIQGFITANNIHGIITLYETMINPDLIKSPTFKPKTEELVIG